jgi:lysophospholipase L1-like esterase
VHRRVLVAGAAIVALLGGTSVAVARPALRPSPPPAPAGPAWSTTWATAPSSAVAARPAGTTIRNVVHTTVGGPSARVRLTNRFGTAPVTFGHVTIALSAHAGGKSWAGTDDPSDGTAAAGTMRDVLFGGAASITVPAGVDLVSDPVPLGVPADSDLLVSVWTPAAPGAVTSHAGTRQLSLISPGPADQAAAPGGESFAGRTFQWLYLSAVEVSGAAGTIVALGDSITNGSGSSDGTNRRYPDLLAARIAGTSRARYGVANSGIGGNRLLLDGGYPRADRFAVAGPSAAARFDADVLDRAGVRTVIILIGINDLLMAPAVTDPGPIVAGLGQLAARARERGLRVIGGTITPFGGWRAWTPAAEQARLAVNEWIRTSGGFDGVADFDQAVRDPADLTRLATDFDSGDHLHPNDAGNQALADAVPLDRL